MRLLLGGEIADKNIGESGFKGDLEMLIAEVETKFKTLNLPEDRIKKVGAIESSDPVFQKEMEQAFSKRHSRTRGIVLRTGDPRHERRRRSPGNKPNKEGRTFERREGDKRKAPPGNLNPSNMTLVYLEDGSLESPQFAPGERVYVESVSTAAEPVAAPDRRRDAPPHKEDDVDYVVDLTAAGSRN